MSSLRPAFTSPLTDTVSRSSMRVLQTGALLVAFLLFVTACGGSADSGDASASPDATVAGATEERASGEDSDAESADSGATNTDGPETGDDSTANPDDVAAGDGSANDEDDSSGDSSSGTVPVTIEPPKQVPNTVPLATTGCEGAGFGQSGGEVTTRIGVLVPDYTGLVDTGFVPRVTPSEYRTRYLASTFGANARNVSSFPGSPFQLPCGEIELVMSTYDPLDPATQRDACLALAEGPGVLVVLSELEDRRGEGVSCLTNEAGIPVLSAGSLTSSDLLAANGQLVSLRPPVDLLGAAAVRSFASMQLFDGQTVGVVGGDDIVTAAASNAVLDELEELGITAVSVVLPSSKGVTDVWAELPEVAEDFAVEDVTVVISMFDAVVNNALWDRMIRQDTQWQFLLIDALGVAEHDKVTRLPDEFNGLVFTSLNSEKEADRTSPASVECIADYAAVVALLETDPAASGLISGVPAFELPANVSGSESDGTTEFPATTVLPEGSDPETTEVTEDDNSDENGDEETGSVDGGPLEDSDDGIETALREVLGESRPPGPACALVTTAIRAVLSAGADLNVATFSDALHNLGPIDLFIEGPGTLTPGKNYVADFGHVLGFERYIEPISEELAAPCDSPDNCWRQLEDLAAAPVPLVPDESTDVEDE